MKKSTSVFHTGSHFHRRKNRRIKTSVTVIDINENIREMVSHLLEDSENSLNTAISEYTTLNCKRGPTVSGNAKPALDPNAHFVSVQLFLNALSSIFGGICNYAFASGNICFEDLMSESVSQWIERLLRISQSTSAHYASLLMQKQNASWHSSHAAYLLLCSAYCLGWDSVFNFSTVKLLGTVF
ncbi:unnamed protein product [Heterobilharzia americana]|nr:unnamed protein product [Heterobilharzia americana]